MTEEVLTQEAEATVEATPEPETKTEATEASAEPVKVEDAPIQEQESPRSDSGLDELAQAAGFAQAGKTHEAVVALIKAVAAPLGAKVEI